MNNDRISKTPGGEQMLSGVIICAFGALLYRAFQYELGDLTRYILLAGMLYGAVMIGRGIFVWKYTDHAAYAEQKAIQNLLIDIPVREQNYEILHQVEDALIELIRSSKSVKIDLHSIDKANNMGTINLRGPDADAMYAHVYATLAKFAMPNGLHLFPKPGHPIDAEIYGKRLLMDLPSLEITL